MDNSKKNEENLIIDDLLKDNADMGDVDLSGVDVDAILKEADIDENDIFKDKSLEFLNTKDDVTMKELLSGIDVDINKSSNPEHLIQNIIKEMNTDITSKKEDTSKKLPKFDNSFDFINFMESKKYKKNEEDKDENIFLLKNYKLNSKKKIEVLKFPPKTTLSSRFFKGGNILTSITANEDVIFTGNNLGIIRVYSCEKEMEYKSFFLEQIQKEPQSKRAVTCMDVSESISHLVCGYFNGFLALWDLSKTNCIKYIPKEHKSCVIAVKFIRIDKNNFEFLSSDLDGKVNRVVVSPGYFITSVECEPIIEYNKPIFLIEVFKFNKEDRKKFRFLEDQTTIVAFGCLDQILIYQLEPIKKKLFEFKKPSYLTSYYVPDISFGVGYIPRNTPSIILDNLEDSSETKEKYDPNPVATKLGLQITTPQRLVSISWGKVIYIYTFIFDPEEGPKSIDLVGHYVNKSPILRMGFLSNSIIYILDMFKCFRILNTGLMTPGQVIFDEKDGTPVFQFNNKHKPELEEEKRLDQDILFQAYVPDEGNKKETKNTYNNLVMSQTKTLYVLGKKTFYLGKLLNWEQCISNLQQEGEWMDLLTLGLDIYHGRNITLAGIPIDENERKKNVASILKGAIMQYSVNNTNIDLNQTKQDKAEEMLNKCIKICIEFCIEINEFEFLLENIKPLFEVRGFLDLFLINLEPFILKHKIAEQKIKKDTIMKIVNIYQSKNKLDILEKIFTHLEISSIDFDEIKDICKKNNFISAIIYIYMNGEKEDMFYPIDKLFEVFCQSKEIPKDKFISYQNVVNTLPKEEYEQSKQYLGHKLFWYINLCIEGIRFPKNENVPEEIRTPLVQKIFLWLLKNKVMDELINFDSFSYFLLLKKLLSDKKNLNIIKQIEYDAILFQDITLKGNSLAKSEILSFIEIIYDKALSFNKIYIKDDLYEFIYKLSTILDTIDKEYILNACNHILNYKNNIELIKKNSEEDPFGVHTEEFRGPDYLKQKSEEVIHMIDYYNKKCNINENNEDENLKTLLKNCKDVEFIEVKLFLLQLLGKNIECFDIYLTEEKIEKKVEKTFHFINNLLNKYKEENKKEKIEEIKQEIIKRVKKLAELSGESLIEIVTDWFDNNHSLILEKLDNDDNLKLIYVENLLNKYKNNANSMEEQKDNNDSYINLLNIHIDLLCKLKQYNKILKCLKENQSYPVGECLKKCLNHKVTDASIYLYQSMGNDQAALNLAVDELKDIFDKIIESLKANNMNEYENLIQKHNKTILECINICENTNESVEEKENENEKMWFDVLQIFYDYSNKIKSLINSEEINNLSLNNTNIKLYFGKLGQLISKDIEDLFEKMYAYTGIKKIIARVSEVNKQAASKEFKPVLTKLLKGYGYLNTILRISRKLLSANTISNLDEERTLIKKGICYKKLTCDQCHRGATEKENRIILFRCGHKIHKNCCLFKNNIFFCNICYNKELNESLSLMDFDNLINGLTKDKTKLNTRYKRKVNNKNEEGSGNDADGGSRNNLINVNKNEINNKFDKLNKINQRSYNNVDMMDIDVDIIRRNKRK